MILKLETQALFGIILFMVAAALFTGIAAAQVTADTVCYNGEWLSRYYAGKAFNTLKTTRCESPGATAKIDKDWSAGPITPLSRTDSASARWTGTFNFGTDGGTYEFTATTDDGVKVFVDGVNVINAWYDKGAYPVTGQKQLTGGNHTVRVDYYENAGDASANIKWTKVTEPPPPPPPGDCPTTAPAGYITSSGSPADEIATGQNVFIPSGSYSLSTIRPAANQHITSTGRANTTLSFSSDALNPQTAGGEIACVTMQTTTPGLTGAWMEAAPASIKIENARFAGFKYGIVGHNNPPPAINVYNTIFDGYDYGLMGNFANGEVVGSTFNTGGGWAAMEINGGHDMRFANNDIHDGSVGIKFLKVYSLGWGKIPTYNHMVEGNTFEGVDEENLGTDMQGNDNSASRATDQVTSATASTITLQSSAWNGQFGDGTYRVGYFDGPCKGLHYKIASQSGRTFTLQNDLGNGAGICVPNAGDDVVVGQPPYNITWRNNIVDATESLAGIDHWGWTYDTTITGNTFSSPDPALHPGNPLLASIEISSLLGMDSVGTVTTVCGREGPVDNVTITNNKILTTDARFSQTEKILIADVRWGGCRWYHASRDTISGNEMPTVVQDVQF